MPRLTVPTGPRRPNRCSSVPQPAVVLTAGRARQEVSGEPGVLTPRVTTGELGLDVLVQHLEAGGAAGIEVVCSEQVLELSVVVHGVPDG